MPRKLPWTTKDSPVVKEKRPRPAPKKREASSSEVDRAEQMKGDSSGPLKGTKKRANCATNGSLTELKR